MITAFVSALNKLFISGVPIILCHNIWIQNGTIVLQSGTSASKLNPPKFHLESSNIDAWVSNLSPQDKTTLIALLQKSQESMYISQIMPLFNIQHYVLYDHNILLFLKHFQTFQTIPLVLLQVSCNCVTVLF